MMDDKTLWRGVTKTKEIWRGVRDLGFVYESKRIVSIYIVKGNKKLRYKKDKAARGIYDSRLKFCDVVPLHAIDNNWKTIDEEHTFMLSQKPY